MPTLFRETTPPGLTTKHAAFIAKARARGQLCIEQPYQLYSEENHEAWRRPPGSRNEKTKLLESLETHGEAIIQQCKLLAMKGDRTALRLCVERLIPIAKPPGTHFRLPAMETAADLKNL